MKLFNAVHSILNEVKGYADDMEKLKGLLPKKVGSQRVEISGPRRGMFVITLPYSGTEDQAHKDMEAKIIPILKEQGVWDRYWIEFANGYIGGSNFLAIEIYDRRAAK